jgi:hypothetical protein
MEIIFVTDNQSPYETEPIYSNSDNSFEQDLLEVHNELEELQREIEQIERDLKIDFVEANAILSGNTPNLPNNPTVTVITRNHLPRNAEHPPSCAISAKKQFYRTIVIIGLLWTVTIAFHFYARGYDYKWRYLLPGTQLRPVYDMMPRETSKKKRITRRSSEPLGRTIDELINSPSNIVTNPRRAREDGQHDQSTQLENNQLDSQPATTRTKDDEDDTMEEEENDADETRPKEVTGTESSSEQHESPSPLLTQQEQHTSSLDTKPAAVDPTNTTEPSMGLQPRQPPPSLEFTSPVARRFSALPSISEITSQYRSSLSPYRLGSIGNILPRAPNGELITNRDQLESIAFSPTAIRATEPLDSATQTREVVPTENNKKGGANPTGGAGTTDNNTPTRENPGQNQTGQPAPVTRNVTPAHTSLKQPPQVQPPSTITPQGPPAGSHAQAIQGPPTLIRTVPAVDHQNAPEPPVDIPNSLHQGPPTAAKPKPTPRNPYDKTDPENLSISARLLASSQNQPSSTAPRSTPGLLAQGFLTSVSRRISWAYVPTFNGPDRVAAEAEERKDPATGDTPDLNDSPDTNVALNEGHRLNVYREPMYLPEVNVNILPVDRTQQTHSSADSNITMESSIRDSTLALPSCENESTQDDQQYQDMGTTSTLSIHRLDNLTRRHSRYLQKTTSSIEKVNSRLTKEINRTYRHMNEISEGVNERNRQFNSIITQINQTIANQDAAIREHLHQLRQQHLIQQNLEAALAQESSIRKQQKDDFNQQIQRLQTTVTTLETKLADVDRKLAATRGEAHRCLNKANEQTQLQKQTQEHIDSKLVGYVTHPEFHAFREQNTAVIENANKSHQDQRTILKQAIESYVDNKLKQIHGSHQDAAQMKQQILSEVQESIKQLKDELAATIPAQSNITHAEVKQLVAATVSDANAIIRRDLDTMVSKLVAAREVKLRAAEIAMKSYVEDQIAQHLAVTDLKITDEQREKLQQEITTSLQTHFQTQWDPNYATIEDNFMELAGVTNEIIKCLRAKCSDDPRVSCWSVLSAFTGTAKLSKVVRNWNLPNDDENHVEPPSQMASEAASSAKDHRVNPVTNAPTPMTSNTPYIPALHTQKLSQPIRASPQFSPYIGRQEPSPAPFHPVPASTGNKQRFQEINHGDSRFTKLNSFPLKLTDISLAVPWYKLFKDKCEYHGIYIPALEEYDVNKPYGTKIP